MTHGGDRPADGGRSSGRGRWSRRTWLLVAVPVAVVVALAVTLLSPWGLVGRGPAGVSLPLPAQVAGLDRREGAASQQTDDLAERLRADPAVAGVAVGAFDDDELSLVVLRLSPLRPFDDETAGRLTAQVLGASGAAQEPGGQVRSVTSDDGEALITCTSPSATSSTCVAVQAREALLVLTSGEVDDPVELAARVRDDVRAG
ncbi:hypothetical protein [Aquipuribacter sp. MA13-6]|uniref:hypothetical protein n=1 Tax=unclassified Aquipuribacter TaxID=2635084 RepID=UPI003EEFB3F6